MEYCREYYYVGSIIRDILFVSEDESRINLCLFPISSSDI